LFIEATKIEPERSEAWIHKGLVLRDLGKNEQALETLNQAIKINSNDWRGWYYKADILIRFGRKDEAVECYRKFISVEREDSSVKYRRIAYQIMGEHFLALEKWMDAIQAFGGILKEKDGMTKGEVEKVRENVTEAVVSFTKENKRKKKESMGVLEIKPKNIFGDNREERGRQGKSIKKKKARRVGKKEKK